jgi:hypothetical protein
MNEWQRGWVLDDCVICVSEIVQNKDAKDEKIQRGFVFFKKNTFSKGKTIKAPKERQERKTKQNEKRSKQQQRCPLKIN